MNKVIEWTQNNIYINAFKNAINKVAFLNLGVAFFVLFFKGLEKSVNLNIDTLFILEYFYYLLMLFFGIVLIQYIVNELLPKEKDLVKISIIFMSFSFLLPFLRDLKKIPAFPIFGSLSAFVIVFVVKRMRHYQLKEINNIPKAATDYFNVLIPIITVMSFSFFLLLGFSMFYENILFIYLKILTYSSHLLVLLLVIILICLFWYLGLHGVAVVSSVMRPLWFQMMLFNTYFLIIDAPIPYIGTETFLQWFVWLGGSGATLGLSISLRYLSKSKTLKELGKGSFSSALHNINETVIFGTPIVKNKNFIIPFFATPLILAVIGYFSITSGIISNFSLLSPWVLPIPLGAFFSSAGSLKVLLLSLFLIFVSWLIYFPFFKVYDNKLIEEEKKIQSFTSF